MNETGTCFILPDNWKNMQFFVESNKSPLKAVTLTDQGNTHFLILDMN